MVNNNRSYVIRPCTAECLSEILYIFNDAIRNSTALYDYQERDMAMMDKWYAARKAGNYPLLGAFDMQGVLLGFATYGLFRERPAYKYSVEHSVYVHPECRGAGIGKALLRELIVQAEKQQYHLMVGVIDADNVVSRKMHEQEGFLLTGVMTEVGFKFGRWLDAAFYQLKLSTPINPVDG